ncbi:MAG: DUF4153 domain-containing protein [Oligoflexia bacterium]|nr:DUF4153 domain-containing protein [Oligoflexia bacterium]MBF0367503.1 DUF4153 domain-containing protein [Oligoflexia bacterium]
MLTFFQTLHRFPLAVLCCLLFCLSAMAGIHKITLESTANHLAILCFGCFWFISSKLYFERKAILLRYYYLASISIFVLVAIYLYTLPMPKLLWPGAFLCLASFALMMVAPFLHPRKDDEQLWPFHYRLCLQILYTTFTSMILVAGIIFLFKSVSYLFSISIRSELYQDIVVIILSLFAPVLAMNGLPLPNQVEEYPSKRDSNFLRLLLEYIILPLLFFYTMMLYAYILKIIFDQSLPRGKCSYLVAYFGVSGIVTYLLSSNAHTFYSKTILLFRRYFFAMLLPPLFLMIYATFYRINEYGFTEPRFVLTLACSWFLFIIFFSLFSRRTLGQFIFLSFIGLTVLSSLGPWSVANLSFWNQLIGYQASPTILKSESSYSLSHRLAKQGILPIKGTYDYLIANLYFYADSTQPSEHLFDLPELQLKLNISYDPNTGIFAVKQDKNPAPILDFNIDDFIVKLKSQVDAKKLDLLEDELIVKGNSDLFSIKLIIKEFVKSEKHKSIRADLLLKRIKM